jgi:hypothetical protein
LTFIAVFVLAGIVVSVGIVVAPGLISKYKTRAIQGTVTWVDHSTRQASLEITNPHDGRRVEISGSVPEECVITINGRPGSLQDLAAGDRALVEGTWNKQSKQVKAFRVQVDRATTQPARETALTQLPTPD